MPVKRKHSWKREPDGSVDYFAYEGDTHNGPQCEACGECFCHHCEPERWQAILDGTDPEECEDWHECPLPSPEFIGEHWVCPEPACGKAYEVSGHWIYKAG